MLRIEPRGRLAGIGPDAVMSDCTGSEETADGFAWTGAVDWTGVVACTGVAVFAARKARICSMTASWAAEGVPETGEMAMPSPCRNMVKAELTLSLLLARTGIILPAKPKGAFAYVG
jgi:hypothetical protein